MFKRRDPLPEIFSKNCASSFTNRFPNELSFHPNSEIAVNEIRFSQSIGYHMTDKATLEIFDFLYERKNKNSKLDSTFGKWYIVDLSLQDLSTAENLAESLNLAIYSKIKRIREVKPKLFHYDQATKRIWTKIREDFWILIKLKGSLLYYLGLEKKAEETSIQYLALGKSKRAYNYQYNKKIRLFSTENNKPCKVLNSEKGVNFFNLKPQLNQPSELMIHIDIIHPQLVGPVMERVIKFLPLDSKNYGKEVVHSFGSCKNYVPLSSFNFNEISIKITDVSGRPIVLPGSVRIELHIKIKK